MTAAQGKQIAVVMSAKDEREFITWLRNTAPIQLLALNAAKTVDLQGAGDLKLDALPALKDGFNRRFAIWNQRFDWTPQVQVRELDVGIINVDSAPVVQYARARPAPAQERAGRLYWSRGMNPTGVFEHAHRRYDYDVEAFALWWRELEDWVKSQAKIQQRDGAKPLYVMPDAARLADSPLARVATWLRGN